MGLDLYAGTLTRYYGKNWKTATQQWAEANGMTYQKIETMPPDKLAVLLGKWEAKKKK